MQLQKTHHLQVVSASTLSDLDTHIPRTLNQDVIKTCKNTQYFCSFSASLFLLDINREQSIPYASPKLHIPYRENCI